MKTYVLGTGPSINEITENEWNYLKNQNTFGFSWFFKKGFAPNWYYTHENDHQPERLRKTILENPEKWSRTKVILGKTDNHQIKLPFPNLYATAVASNHLKAFNGQQWPHQFPEPPISFENFWAKSFERPLCGFRGQLAAVINAAHILGASEIALCGIDLYDNSHFYPDEEGSQHVENLRRIMNFDPVKDNHSQMAKLYGSATIVDFVKYISKYITISCCSQRSLLNEVIKYEPIGSR
ncbi:MAG TPA: hypothetical protein PLA71_01050 [Saccharofermentans sp.]|nr:hypothetical protein [Saccharofermentans sp.]